MTRRSTRRKKSAAGSAKAFPPFQEFARAVRPKREETRFGGRAHRKNDCGMAEADCAEGPDSFLSVVPAEREGIRADGSLAFGDQIGKAIEDCGGRARWLLGENALNGKVEKRIRDERPLSRAVAAETSSSRR